MSAQWFRFYSEVLDDPKVQMLPAAEFKAWVNILCLASKYDGVLPDVSAVSFALRIDETGVLTLLERLLNAGLIDKRNGGPNGYHYAPHSWAKRQYKSDSSTDRVKRYRERLKRSDETAPEAETEADISSEAKASSDSAHEGGESGRSSEIVGRDFASLIAEAIEVWKSAAKQCGWSIPQKLTPDRRKKLSARLKEHGIDGWRAAVKRASRSAMLGRDPPRWWDFDFLIRSHDQIIKVLEGKYDEQFNRNQPSPSGSAGQSRTAVAARRSMDRVARFWPDPSDADGGREGGFGEHGREADLRQSQTVLRPDDALPGPLRRIGDGPR